MHELREARASSGTVCRWEVGKYEYQNLSDRYEVNLVVFIHIDELIVSKCLHGPGIVSPY